jgi:hypothetical protein
MNGLGFDYRRFSSGVRPGSDPQVDPIVELLCFCALVLFPVRGDGKNLRQRGWVQLEDRSRQRFVWPTWTSPIDQWGIDALLDVVHADPMARKELSRLGVNAMFASVERRPAGDQDVNRGYATERLW